jgi:hypothetical protein
MPYYSDLFTNDIQSFEILADISDGRYVAENVNVTGLNWSNVNFAAATKYSTVYSGGNYLVTIGGVQYTGYVLDKTSPYTTPEYLYKWQLDMLPVTVATLQNVSRISVMQFQDGSDWVKVVTYLETNGDLKAVEISRGPAQWAWVGDYSG